MCTIFVPQLSDTVEMYSYNKTVIEIVEKGVRNERRFDACALIPEQKKRKMLHHVQ